MEEKGCAFQIMRPWWQRTQIYPHHPNSPYLPGSVIYSRCSNNLSYPSASSVMQFSRPNSIVRQSKFLRTVFTHCQGQEIIPMGSNLPPFKDITHVTPPPDLQHANVNAPTNYCIPHSPPSLRLCQQRVPHEHADRSSTVPAQGLISLVVSWGEGLHV